MIDQIIEFNIMSPLLGDGYKAGGIGGNQNSSAGAEGCCGSWIYQTGEPTSLAVCHRPYCPSAAHSPDDMGTH